MDSTEIRDTTTMQADADIVLNTAADRSQETSWLPDRLRGCELDLDAEGRTIRWVRDDEQQGRLTARPSGAGSSEVELLTSREAADDDSLRVALRALEAAVAEKLTAG
ncbi:hypothetical protein [Lentzea sp.]|uniref:hypothetical protein n=1 Tax=Lentzea sp. TaxID=56099 RepID=UPI002ED0B292